METHDYEDNDPDHAEQEIKEISFDGLTGRISFDEQGRRRNFTLDVLEMTVITIIFIRIMIIMIIIFIEIIMIMIMTIILA